MRDRKKRTIMIGALCCLLVFMGIGYAVLSQVLNINGTATLEGAWKIRISNITVEEVFGGATNVDEKLTFTDTEATFGVNLSKPGDKIKYKVTVVNEGNIDAVLSINQTTIAHKDIKFTNTLNSGEILYGSSSANGTSKLSETEFYVTAEFSEFATTLTNGETSEYKIQLIYTQYDGNNFYEPPKNVETDNGVFQVSADGTILDYNENLGTHVSIPASVDGIPITRIDSNAFKSEKLVYNYDYKAVLDISTGAPIYGVIFNEEKEEEIRKMVADAQINIDIYMPEDPGIPGVGANQIEGYFTMNGGDPILSNSPDFIGEMSPKKILAIDSLDLSNATNLEQIDEFAFSNATIDLDLTSQTIKTGLKKLSFGNNTKEIKLGEGVFAGADLDTLKTYTTLRPVTTLAPNIDSLDEELLGKPYAPFAGSSIDTLIIQPTKTIVEPIVGVMKISEEHGLEHQLGTYQCISKVKKLYLEEGITAATDRLFMFSMIDSINLPNTLKKIGFQTFSLVTTNDFVIPKSVTALDEDSYLNSSSFVWMTVNGTLTINGPSILKNLDFDRITANTVNIGKNVSQIEANAFDRATIGEVNIASTNTVVENGAFPTGTVIKYPN